MKNENRNQSLSRRRFFKQAAVAGAALALPSGLNRVWGGNTPAASKSTGNQTPAARGVVITARRVLGSGAAAMEVSALGFGVMGMTYNRSQHPGKRECIALLHEAVERGVTLFDTAIIYGPWSNERLAGEALSAFGDHICVTTKFGHEVVDGRATGRQDSRPATIRRYCEESLRRLRIDAIPLFYQHRFDPQVPVEEVAGALGDLIREGKVLRWGLCEVGAETIRKAHAVQPLIAVQSEYHLMHRAVEENGVLDTCGELGIGFVPYSPMNRGFLGGCINEYTVFDEHNDNRPTLPRFQPEAIRANLRIVNVLQEFGRTRGMTSAQVALGWLDRLGGALFGAAKYLVILSILLNLVHLVDSKIRVLPSHAVATAHLYQHTLRVAPALFSIAQEQLAAGNKPDDRLFIPCATASDEPYLCCENSKDD